jgi:hypothetical protein
VFSCAEVLSCQSACPTAGQLIALGKGEPVPAQPVCGPQPPCTPMCAQALPGTAPPRATCSRGRCAVKAMDGTSTRDDHR